MANPAFETVDPPYTAFRFEVVLNLDDPPPGVTNPACHAAFAECDGLEMSIEPKTIRSGGDNRRQQHFIGPTSYSQLTLKRGMTANLDLWNWFLATTQTGRVSTAQGQVTLWDADGTPRITFVLEDCLPVKMRAPALNAKDGQVAIEEMQLVYASLVVKPAGSSLNVSIGFGASATAGFSASASLSVSGGPGLSGSLDASASASAGLNIG
ncbi:MAG: phage tail protein [Ktedonobacteraceae bacterium]